jgi:hypothetical protein
MARVREFIIAVIVAVEFCNAASVRAGEIPTYLNVNPSATTAAPPSPPTGISPGLANRGSGNNGNGSSFCQQPIYDNWGCYGLPAGRLLTPSWGGIVGFGRSYRDSCLLVHGWRVAKLRTGAYLFNRQ